MRKTILTALGLTTVAAAIALAPPQGAIKAPRNGAMTLASPQKAMLRAESTAFSLPLLYEPTSAQFDNSILLNANDDNKTWKPMTGSINYGYSMYNDADEWLFVPIQLNKEENSLKVSAEYKAQNSDYKESFEICFGKEATPESMVIPCIDVVNFTNTQYKTVEEICTVNGSGLVYMGIHAKSQKDMYGLYVRNISVIDFSSPVPLAPSIESNSIDGLDYTASVRMPSSTKQGKDIVGKVGLSVAVDGVEAKDLAECDPGSLQEISLHLTKGTHTISYTAYVMDGETKSLSEAVAHDVKAVSNDPVELPFFCAPTAEDWDDCIVVDSNKDDVTWDYNTREECFAYYYTNNAADDWLFLPVINFGAKGGAFDLSLEAKVASKSSPESFEVCVGRSASPDAMTSMMSQIGITNEYFEEYTGKITLPEGGNWYVGIHCVSDADMWNLYIANISITAAADITPAIPTVKSVDFNGLEGNITYTLPSKTVEDKDITVPVGLIVSVDSKEVCRTEPVAAGSDVVVPLTLAIGNRTITTSAFVTDGENELIGSPVVTKVLARNPEGYSYPLPFEMRPTLGEFETLTTLDANGSGLEWTYNSGADNGKGAVMMRTADDKASDAWIFFPQVAIEDVNRIYTVSADVRAYLEQFPEDFDICVGKTATPEAMTDTVVSRRNYNNYLYATQAGEFIAPEAGSYVIGIHRLSDGQAHTLSFCNVKMYDSGNSASAPVAPADVIAESDLTGAPKATVSFTMPVSGVNGNTLDASEELTATITSQTGANTVVKGLPGARVSCEIEAVEGINEFTVVVTSPTHGEGKPAKAKAYCGYDRPAAPTVSAAVAEDNMSLVITWSDAPRGVNGGAVNTATLSHKIYVPVDENGEYWQLVAEVPAGTNSYTYAVPQLQNQTIIGVAAENTKGTSNLGVAFDITGTPYPLPMSEDFSSGRILYQPLLTPTPTEEYTGWMFGETKDIFPGVQDMPTALFCINNAALGAKHGRLSLPKFSTVGSPKVRLTLNVFTSAVAPAATLYANIYGASDVKIADIDASGDNQWKDVEIELPAELLNKKWVNLYVEVNFKGGSEVFVIKSYEVRAIFDKQLSVVLSAPDEFVVGDVHTITGRVSNPSETTLAMPVVKCTLGDTELESETVATEIKPGETLRYTYTVNPTADMVGTHTLHFELCDYTDEVNDDNSAEREISVGTGVKPIVLDLDGSAHEYGGVMLTWTAPEIKKTGDEDFESYAAFDYSENLGVWTNRDGDGKYVYVFQGASFPGMGEPKAFQVVNTDLMPAGIVPDAYSGKQYLMAITPEDGSEADDWLISPEVVPGSTVSFRLNILSEAYGMEQVDLMWSADGKDFTLLQTYSQTLRGWNPLEITLPAEARYFAFHYHCTDIFGICLDDIHFTPVSDAEIDSYNIYCNGQLTAEKHSDTSYIHLEARNGDSYNVSVVTRSGEKITEHPLSNTYVARGVSGLGGISAAGKVAGIEGAIVITGYEGAAANIFTTDGKRIAAIDRLGSRESVAVNAGVYVVTIDGVAVKVVVM